MENERKLDQSRAPVYEALQTFRHMRVVPFDVPGHKHGRGNPELTAFLGEQCVSIDVNSMKPLDNLCHPVSVIREAEILTADAFGAAHAFLMKEGQKCSGTGKQYDRSAVDRNTAGQKCNRTEMQQDRSATGQKCSGTEVQRDRNAARQKD